MTETVREIALVNSTGAMDPATFAFTAEAIRIQIERDFLPAWRDYMPVKRPLTVVGYNSTKDLAPGSFSPIVVKALLDRQGVLGDHVGTSDGDVASGRSLPLSHVMSHEALELACDPYTDRWLRLPSGMVVALEICDMVENDTYAIEASIAGQTRSVSVSNFAHPAWFGEGIGRLDQMGLCTLPEENRGYLIVRNGDGSTSNVFAATASAAYRARVEKKAQLAQTRTTERLKSRP